MAKYIESAGFDSLLSHKCKSLIIKEYQMNNNQATVSLPVNTYPLVTMVSKLTISKRSRVDDDMVKECIRTFKHAKLSQNK
jgi:hypothetical protein